MKAYFQNIYALLQSMDQNIRYSFTPILSPQQIIEDYSHASSTTYLIPEIIDDYCSSPSSKNPISDTLSKTIIEDHPPSQNVEDVSKPKTKNETNFATFFTAQPMVSKNIWQKLTNTMLNTGYRFFLTASTTNENASVKNSYLEVLTKALNAFQKILEKNDFDFSCPTVQEKKQLEEAIHLALLCSEITHGKDFLSGGQTVQLACNLLQFQYIQPNYHDFCSVKNS